LGALYFDANPVWYVAFASHALVSAHGDDTIVLWDVDMDSWQSRACRRANRNLTQAEWGEFIGPDIPYRRTCPNLPLVGGGDDLSRLGFGPTRSGRDWTGSYAPGHQRLSGHGDRGGPIASTQMSSQICAWFSERFDTPDLKEAEALLVALA
jgi:hypothetical protein